MPRPLRFLLRWTLKAAHAALPAGIGARILRLPFSRLASRLPALIGGVEVCVWRGIRLEVDPSEVEGFYRFFLPAGPDPEFDWLRSACSDARVFLDVGANQGIYALALAAAHPQLTVVAFEPDPGNIERMRRNVALNPAVASRVRLEPKAVTAASGSVVFERSAGLNSGTGRVVESSAGANAVSAVALDDYLQQTGLAADVIKVDVEGGELDVIEGLGGRCPRAMAIEVHAHLWPVAERHQFKQRLVSAMRALPLRWRFLHEEREWRDALDPGDEWPERLHAFGHTPPP